jgi:hypothetical protein
MTPAKLKSYAWIDIICAAGIALIIAASTLANSGSLAQPAQIATTLVTTRATAAPTATPLAVVNLPTDEAVRANEEIPRYPDALFDSNWCKRPEVNECGIALFTNASVEQVIEYYRDVLTRQGWTVADDSGHDDWSIWGLELVRINSEGKFPPRQLLTIIASKSPEEAYVTYITIDWQRWPDPLNIPLFPQRENVVDKLEDKDGYCADMERTITYETSATAEKVYSYYEQIMPLHGWSMEEPVGDLFRSFGWGRGFPEPEPPFGGYSGVTLIVEPSFEVGKPTRVKLQASASAYGLRCMELKGTPIPTR